METMRAVIYARVSTEDQVEGTSLDHQAEFARKYCDQKGYSVLGEFREDISGVAAIRPELDKIIEMADSFDVLVCYSIDRFSRDLGVLLALESEIKTKGARLEFVQGGFDDTPEGQLQKHLIASIAQYERTQILRRTMFGLQSRARAGRVTHSHTPPYGYDYVEGYFVINEEQAEIVKQIYKWYVVNKYSSMKIANLLTKKRVPTKYDVEGKKKRVRGKGDWFAGSVLQILKRRVYIGEFTFGDITIDTPRIISDELFGAAQLHRKRNAVKRKRQTKNEYLLSQRLYCTTCGRMMYAKTHKSKSGNYYYYVCNGHKKERMPEGEEPTCRGYVRVKTLDDLAWDKLREVVLDPRKYVDAFREKQAAEDAELVVNRIAELEKEREDLNKRRAELLPRYTAGVFTDEELDEAAGALVRMIADIDKELMDLRPQRIKTVFDANEWEYGHDFLNRLDEVNYEEKKELMDVFDVKAYATRLGGGKADLWIEGIRNGEEFIN